MKAYHIFSTMPTFCKHVDMNIEDKVENLLEGFNDLSIMSLILSINKWKDHNGVIELVTDEVGYKLFQRLGIIHLWDSVDTEIMKSLPSDINHSTYWAYSKIYALSKLKPPFFIMDLDFIVWENIEHLYKDLNFISTHREELHQFYPCKEYFGDRQWDDKLDWEALPINTALTFWNDQELIDEYYKQSTQFILDHNDIEHHFCIPMVFAEQRILPMVMQYMNKEVHTFLDLDYSKMADGSEQKYFTHIWGLKYTSDNDLREKLGNRLFKRITDDYPYLIDCVSRIDCLYDYYKYFINNQE